jgi:hypothetical protein
MLAYILAIAIALASVVLFFSAFFAPKLHRKDDFLWSGVGLFYGLILWLCAGRFTGGALLGQVAAVVLVLSFAWQTISLRAAIANPEKQAGIKTFSLLDWIGGGLGKKKAKVQPTVKPVVEAVTPVETTESLTETPAEPVEMVETEVTESVSPEDAIAADMDDEITDGTVEPETSVSPEIEEILVPEKIAISSEEFLVETVEKTKETITPPRARTSQPFAKPKKQGFFSKLFGKKPTPPKTDNITAALDAIETVEEAGKQKEDINKVNVTYTKTVQERVIITENLDSEESDISVTEVITQIETVELPEVISAAETPADNEIEENWDDDWEAENDSEISQVITDQSAPTMIENAIAAIPSQTPTETEGQTDPSSQISPKFSTYIEPTLEAVNPEEKPLFEESPTEPD